MSPKRKNTITFKLLEPDTRLSSLLQFDPPPFRDVSETFVQLKYLEDYIRRIDLAAASAARVVAVETHYKDRDFMADHSVLFSNTLYPPDNYCTRLHFFIGENPDEVEEKLLALGNILRKKDALESDYVGACREFSDTRYLGFAVIRPLPACRVGRTVLRLLPAQKEDGSRRLLRCVRDYDTHFMGVTLNIKGLPFQQQDLGVSRCATIAIWCALHKVGDGEVISHVTPAEITNLASRYRLPFGRPMPSEGLAVDQMCLALQSVGVSPFLAKVTNFQMGRSLIYSAALSGIPSILILQKVGKPEIQHAVTVVGIKMTERDQPDFQEHKNLVVGDDSGSLQAAYVQDDRIGPYRRAEIVQSASNQLMCRIKEQSHTPSGRLQDWTVTHVLVPLLPKIRISFNDLRTITRSWLLPEVQSVIFAASNVEKLPDLQPPTFRYWIERGHRYIQRVLKERLLAPEAEERFRREFILPRYIGVVRIGSPHFGHIDILIDTTSPKPNYVWLGVLAESDQTDTGKLRLLIAEYIAEKCWCELFI